MMRTVEVLIVIIIILGAFGVTSFYTVLPSPRQVAPINLRRLAFTSLETLDNNHALSMAAFDSKNTTRWSNLQVALSAMLPPDVIYNLTVYDVNGAASGTQLYTLNQSISNAATLGSASDASTYTVASSNVTFSVTPERIGENGAGGTLYILNCSDASGWWITGYTAQSLAKDLCSLLSPFFLKTVVVQNTAELRQLLDGQRLTNDQKESVTDAVVINTFGECVPMPQEYSQTGSRASQGYNSSGGYAKYCYTLGALTRVYNWTWASIVGWPFYYVSNTAVFPNGQNGWGIYGMNMVASGGIRAFLQGINNQPYQYDTTAATDSANRQATLSASVADLCNYYGIYPSEYQTSTRALSILPGYNLEVGLYVFNPQGNYLPGAIYNHVFSGSSDITGSLLALGLTRTPDIRVTALSLLSYYQPRLHPSDFTALGTNRLVILQLGLSGGT